MEHNDSVALTRRLMDAHNLTDWGVSVSQATSYYGMCDRNRKIIRISVKLFAEMTETECEQVVLHEIAHALTPGHGHDAVWKEKARSIGYTGKRCGEHAAQYENLAVPASTPIRTGDRITLKPGLFGTVGTKRRTKWNVTDDNGVTYAAPEQLIIRNRISTGEKTPTETTTPVETKTVVVTPENDNAPIRTGDRVIIDKNGNLGTVKNKRRTRWVIRADSGEEYTAPENFILSHRVDAPAAETPKTKTVEHAPIRTGDRIRINENGLLGTVMNKRRVNWLVRADNGVEYVVAPNVIIRRRVAA